MTTGYVATCAHVVRDALGIAKGQEPLTAPKDMVRLDFPFLEGEPAIAAEVAWWRYHPVDGEPRGFRDLAILRLPRTPALAETGTLMLRRPDDLAGFHAYGFARAEGHWIDGAVRGARGDGWLQLRGEKLEHYFVDGGFSGAPAVLNDDRVEGEPIARVFALIALNEPERLIHEAFAIPAAFIKAALDACSRQSKADELSLLHAALADVGACFQSVKRDTNDARFQRRMATLLESLEADLDDFDEAGPDVHVVNVAERARALAELYREAVDRGYARHFARIGFDTLANKLSTLTEGVTIKGADGQGLISNDWQADGMEEQIARIDDLLDEIDALEVKVRGWPGDTQPDDRANLLGALRRLKGELLAPKIDPLALAAVQNRIEDIKAALDLFRRLLVQQELFLGRHARHLPPRAIFRDADFGPSMVVIAPGSFWMGSPDKEGGRFDNEGPQHQVTIVRRFALGRYPVTFEEYDRFCAEQAGVDLPGDEGWRRGRRPVINVSCEDAAAYLAWLGDRCGCSYRLPSEAEWEFACRAEKETRYSFGDEISEALANYGGNLGKTSEVGIYTHNPFGLYDMHGNVLEWCADTWHDTYQGAPTDGSVWLEASHESTAVVRGGSWINLPRYCRSAFRSGFGRVNRSGFVGFRAARTLG